jgi:hypothetical protein
VSAARHHSTFGLAEESAFLFTCDRAYSSEKATNKMMVMYSIKEQQVARAIQSLRAASPPGQGEVFQFSVDELCDFYFEQPYCTYERKPSYRSSMIHCLNSMSLKSALLGEGKLTKVSGVGRGAKGEYALEGNLINLAEKVQG